MNFETRNILYVTVVDPQICIKAKFSKLHLATFCIQLHTSISNHHLHFCTEIRIKILFFKTKRIQFNCQNMQTKNMNWDNFALELVQQTKPKVTEVIYDEVDFDLQDFETCINHALTLIPEEA